MTPRFGPSWIRLSANSTGARIVSVGAVSLWLLASGSAQTIQDPARPRRPALSPPPSTAAQPLQLQPLDAQHRDAQHRDARHRDAESAWVQPADDAPADPSPSPAARPFRGPHGGLRVPVAPPFAQPPFASAAAADRTRPGTPDQGSRPLAMAQAVPARKPVPVVEPELTAPSVIAEDDRGPSPAQVESPSLAGWVDLARPERLPSLLQTAATLTLFSLAPAVLLMTTSFVRISVVLGLLRQAIGTQMLPSNQIVTSLAVFLTLLIMAPVWQQVYALAVVPYTTADSSVDGVLALQAGMRPVREFMSRQIELAGNRQDVLLFLDYLPAGTATPETYDDVPLQVLLPAFMLSELKTGFLIGFQVFLPFLILDLVVSSVTVSMGMMMLPPHLVSLPLKLMLFVLVDGWHLVVGMLLDSFGGAA